MTLQSYLDTEKERPAAFARRIKVEPSTVHKYLKQGYIPGREIMERIVSATDGAVTASDFYDKPKAKRRKAS